METDNQPKTESSESNVNNLQELQNLLAAPYDIYSMSVDRVKSIVADLEKLESLRAENNHLGQLFDEWTKSDSKGLAKFYAELEELREENKERRDELAYVRGLQSAAKGG